MVIRMAGSPHPVLWAIGDSILPRGRSVHDGPEVLDGIASNVITPPRNHGGVIFSLQFVCVCVCLCVRISCEQNSSRTDVPIWMRFSLNGCLPHWSNPIEIGDLGSKVKVTVTENVCKNDEK